ncbi:MAG TPA: HlyD family secretion protein [Thermoanaerobaculia bacterium]|nr:HlyD family secretion protein [Thermoanaerobaculia bacterium]
MSRKWIALVVILAVALVVAAAGYRSWKHAQVHPSTEDAFVGGDVYSVSSRIPGTLLTVDVSENEPVRQGQILATLDPRDADAQVDQSETALAEARAALATRRAEIEQQRAKAAADASRLELARTNLARYTELIGKNSIPRARYDDAAAAESVAAEELTAARKSLAAKEADLGVAEQRVRVQESRLRTARLNRSYCAIAAIVDGVVSKLTATAGQVVAPGQPLCAVVPLTGDHIWVEANFKETELPRIRIGQPAVFHTDVNPGRAYHGRVESLSAGTGAAFALLPAENATGNWIKIVQRLPVRIAIDPESNRDGSLRLGLSVHVEIDTLAEPAPTPAAASVRTPVPG